MSHKPIHFVKKITAALLFGALLSFGCASIAMTQEKDQPTLPDIDKQVAALKKSFTGLYGTLWNKHNLSARLRYCVARAVDDYSGFFTAFADKEDYIKAQKEINNLMSGSFNNLLRELEKEFDVIFSEHVVTYYRDLFQNLLENADDPADMAKLKEGDDKFSKDPALRQEFTSGTKKDDRNLLDTIDDIVGFPDKVKTYNNIIKGASKEMIGEEIDLLKWGLNKLGRSAAASLAADLAAVGATIFADPLIGVPYGVYRLGRDLYKWGKAIVAIGNGAETMRNNLYDPLHRYYRFRMPEDLWKQMDKPVRTSLQQIYAQIIRESIDAVDRQDPPAAAPSLYENPTGIPEQSEEYKKGLALHDEKKYNDARPFYEAGAKKGDPWCMSSLGAYYVRGRGGLSKDAERGVALLKKATEMNCPEALYNLGLFYTEGMHDLTKDTQKGLELTRRAAELNHPEANYWLGKCYMEGSYGLSANSQKGLELICKAAKLNDPEANYCLGNYYSNGTHVAQNFQTARDYYKKARELGDKRASKGLYGLEHLPDFFITPEQLAWEYATDKKAADRKYEGHTLRMSGVISKIYPYSEQLHRISFVFDVPGSGFVSCVFSKEDQIREVQSLKKGDWVTVQGEIGGLLFGWCDNCWLVCTD